jgi:ABC-type proline/glycine betaine transport system permease subunit
VEFEISLRTDFFDTIKLLTVLHTVVGKEDEPMYGPVYVIIWIVLLALPVLAAWKRRWWTFVVYAAGCLVFLFEVDKGNGGWEDLANFATLIVVVIPIYIVGSVVWFVGVIMDRYRKKIDRTHHD